MPKPILVSIITPTYNRAEKFLPETIESVQAQIEHGFVHEHIIVDNASSDNTKAVVAKYAKSDPRIKYIRNKKNLKAAGALNVGFKASKGQLIYPLDDDDLIMPRTLDGYVRFFNEHPEFDWAYAYFMKIDEERRISFSTWSPKVYKNPAHAFWSSFRYTFICNGTVVIRRDAVKKVKGWDQVQACQDYVMWLKLFHAGMRAGLLKQYQLLYRVHSDQETKRNRGKGGTWEQVRLDLLKKYKTSEEEIIKKYDAIPAHQKKSKK